MAAANETGTSEPISASRRIEAPRADIFDFLRELENHWLLADRFIEVLELDRSPGGRVQGGRVRMHGPFGARRTATTRVFATDPDGAMSGTAELAGGTRALVTWRISGDGNTTRVELRAELERTGLLDRLLLALGGRRWLRGRFAAILDTLALRFTSAR